MAKHGISLLPDCRKDERSATDYYRDALAIARQADAAGLSYVKMTEHYLGEYGGYCPDPLTFLATVAGMTSQIRLMTGALIPAFHHPVQIAARTAMVDAISGGRLDVGFGRAWLPYEFEAFGVPIAESRERYVATIDAVLDLWTKPIVSADTPFFSYSDATSFPAVTQSPHPPVWGAAVRSPESFTWLGEQGFGLMLALPPLKKDVGACAYLVSKYRDAFRQAHGSSASPRVAISIPVYIADTDDIAFAEVQSLHDAYIDVWGDAVASWATANSSAYPGYEAMARHAVHLRDASVRDECTAIVGSPESVAGQIRKIDAELEIDVFLWGIDFGGQDITVMSKNLERLTRDVLPSL